MRWWWVRNISKDFIFFFYSRNSNMIKLKSFCISWLGIVKLHLNIFVWNGVLIVEWILSKHVSYSQGKMEKNFNVINNNTNKNVFLTLLPLQSPKKFLHRCNYTQLTWWHMPKKCNLTNSKEYNQCTLLSFHCFQTNLIRKTYSLINVSLMNRQS